MKATAQRENCLKNLS